MSATQAHGARTLVAGDGGTGLRGRVRVVQEQADKDQHGDEVAAQNLSQMPRMSAKHRAHQPQQPATRAIPPPNTNKRRVRASMDMCRARAHHTVPHSRQQHAATAPQSVRIKSSNGAVRTRRKDSSSPGSSESCLRSVKVVGTFCAIVADGDGGWGSEDMVGWCGGACLTADGQVQWLAGQQH